MAPTEVLARQHALTLERLLAASQVRRVQLTGGLAAKQRTALLEQIAAGEIDLVVGTQAIIQEDVQFARLGPGGDRRAAQVRRAPAGGVEASRARSALPGDDGHAHPADRGDDALRRPGRLDRSRESPPGRQTVHTYLATRGAARPLVGVLPQEAPRGAAGLRGHAAGRGVGPVRRPSASKRPTRRWPTASWRPSAWG